MGLNNFYNFKNTIRHFVNIDNLSYPSDISSFSTEDLCWTIPIPYRIKKENDVYRTIKMPNPLNFVRAYNYYCGLPNFTTVNNIDPQHKRLSVNMSTGDFVAGDYNKQLDEDFSKLCAYDYLLKLDISEYYGKIYTHYLDLKSLYNLNDNVLSSLYNGRTSGVLMGNYLSLYFAEYMLSKICKEIQENIDAEDINCEFNHFSDDFFFFCNESDTERIITIFDAALQKFDFSRKEKSHSIWDYETYNAYNILTRYWKATIRHWNLEVLKDYENARKHRRSSSHKLVFLNQLIYRLSSLSDEKSKRIFVTNFFKTKHFQETDFNNYDVKTYDYHQLSFLLKLAPETLLYTSYIFNNMRSFDNNSIKDFLLARYKEALKKPLHDEQLCYYFALKCYGFSNLLPSTTPLVLESQNQVLISYYLKDNLFSQAQKDTLKLLTDEQYWFQNYHLILYSPELMSDLITNIDKYLIPNMALGKTNKEIRYRNFYHDNLCAGNAMINDISQVISNIQQYLSLRHEETAIEFEEEEVEDVEIEEL